MRERVGERAASADSAACGRAGPNVLKVPLHVPGRVDRLFQFCGIDWKCGVGKLCGAWLVIGMLVIGIECMVKMIFIVLKINGGKSYSFMSHMIYDSGEKFN